MHKYSAPEAVTETPETIIETGKMLAISARRIRDEFERTREYPIGEIAALDQAVTELLPKLGDAVEAIDSYELKDLGMHTLGTLTEYIRWSEGDKQ